MADKKEAPLPGSIMRNMFTTLMVTGILLYVGWLVAASFVNGKVILFDLGLYSITIIMFLMGLTGRYLYGLKMNKDPARD